MHLTSVLAKYMHRKKILAYFEHVRKLDISVCLQEINCIIENKNITLQDILQNIS